MVDDQITARLQIHTAAQGAGDLFIDIEEIEDGPLTGVVLNFLQRGGHELFGELLQQRGLLLGVHADALGLGVGQVAKHALHEVEVFVQQGQRRARAGGRLDALPGLAQVGDVLGQGLVGGVFGVGAQNETPIGLGQGHQTLAQRFALCGWDFLRHTDVLVLRQIHQQTPRDADLRGQPRAFGADRVFEHLHQDRLAFEDLFFNGQRGVGHVLARLAAALSGFGAGVFGRDAGQQIGHVQKRGAVQTDVNEGRLHAGQDPRDLAQIHIADQATLERALLVHLLNHPLLDHRHAGFLRRPVDEDVLSHGVVFQYKGWPAWAMSCAVCSAGSPMMPE